MAFFKFPFNIRSIDRIAPYFFIGTTILIVIFNDQFGKDNGFTEFALVFFILMPIWAIRWLILQIRSIQKLKKEKQQVELMHLKNQVNPHFFFNTLNNLYGLVGQDSVKAQALILKLADMMRYSIYDGQNEWVPLADEITYLENYMDLHRMRYHKSIDIRFTIEVEDDGIQIMPLLLIILVENAFKHGVEKLRADAFVHIRLLATKQLLDFEIENNFDAEEMNGREGIGLKNLKKRLDFVYQNRHELDLSPDRGGFYKARLRLRL